MLNIAKHFVGILRYALYCVATSLYLFVSSAPASAVEGYDSYNHTRISIVSGDKIAIGEDLGIFIWDEQRFTAVEIERISPNGEDIELDVTDKKTNKYYIFSVASDDPGIDMLPQYDPGLPFPELLSPEISKNYDLLKARGNMINQGDLIDQGDMISGKSRLAEKSIIDDENLMHEDVLPSEDYLMDRGMEPAE